MLPMPLDTFLFDVFVARYLYYSACFVVFSLRLGPDVDPLTTFCPAATCYCRDAFANQLASADPHTSGNQARYQKNVIVVFFFSVGSCDVYDPFLLSSRDCALLRRLQMEYIPHRKRPKPVIHLPDPLASHHSLILQKIFQISF